MADSQQVPPGDESSDCFTLAVSAATDENGVRADDTSRRAMTQPARILLNNFQLKTMA